MTSAPISTELLAAWPLFGLRLHCGDLTLRTVTDQDATAIGELLEVGILPAGSAHFMPRLLLGRAATRAQRFRQLLQYYWRQRVETTPDGWSLEFSVVHRGQVVGIQSIRAHDLAACGEVRGPAGRSPSGHPSKGIVSARSPRWSRSAAVSATRPVPLRAYSTSPHSNGSGVPSNPSRTFRTRSNASAGADVA